MHLTITDSDNNFGTFFDEPHFITIKDQDIFIEKDYLNEKILLPHENINSDQIKIFIDLHTSPLHYIVVVFGKIINAVENFNNPLIILISSRLKVGWLQEKMISFLYKFLKDNNINYKLVDAYDEQKCFISNKFYYPGTRNEYTTPNPINKINKYFLKYINNKNTVPFKKVYLSRKMVKNTEGGIFEYGNSEQHKRIDDENILENFFASKGFEIVYPEQFDSFEDQINYFYDVKTLVSLSGGGALNAIMMQEKTNVVELITDLITPFGPGNPESLYGRYIIAHHQFFSNISFERNIYYFGISNKKKSANIIIEKIMQNRLIMELINA